MAKSPVKSPVKSSLKSPPEPPSSRNGPVLSMRGNALQLKVLLSPNAKKNAILGEHEGSLKISLSAPAIEGRANEALRAFLSKLLGTPKSKIQISQGQKSRKKTLLLEGLELPQAKKALGID